MTECQTSVLKLRLVEVPCQWHESFERSKPHFRKLLKKVKHFNMQTMEQLHKTASYPNISCPILKEHICSCITFFQKKNKYKSNIYLAPKVFSSKIELANTP